MMQKVTRKTMIERIVRLRRWPHLEKANCLIRVAATPMSDMLCRSRRRNVACFLIRVDTATISQRYGLQRMRRSAESIKILRVLAKDGHCAHAALIGLTLAYDTVIRCASRAVSASMRRPCCLAACTLRGKRGRMQGTITNPCSSNSNQAPNQPESCACEHVMHTQFRRRIVSRAIKYRMRRDTHSSTYIT